MANHSFPDRKKVIANATKLLVFLTVFLATAFILFNLLSKRGGNRNYTNIPKEFHLTYMPADFKVNIDEENALAILSNPNRYKREFDKLVYDFNLSLLNHVANRMGLNSRMKQDIQKEYEAQHSYIRGMYYNDFVTIKDTTSVGYKTWYGTELMDATDYFNEVASKYTCFMVNLILVKVLETHNGTIAAKGSKVETPCGIALTEGLRPMVKRLQERAAIEDFSRSKGFVQERVEKSIAELATMEVTNTKALNRKLQTKMWGYAVSSTDVEMSATSHVKIGFDLSNHFSISVDTKGKMVAVTLPEPKILSMEVYPRVDKIDIGWLRELKSSDFNSDMKALADAFRQDVIQSEVFNQSKAQVAELMNTMLEPVVASLGKDYRLKVQFTGRNEDIEFNEASTSGSVVSRASSTGF
ncbi:MAG: DUF4230 domain-containing protein [Saprospiraceae bacterium]|nr:DUF4230 domain-containing protein [Saprospiraceae bacterium]